VLVKDYQFAAAHSSVPVKVILPGPYTLAYCTQAPAGHKTQLLQDYTAALREEVFALSAAGVPLIQIDEPLILRHKEDWGLCADAITHIFQHCHTKRAFTTFFGAIDNVYPKILDLPVDVLGLDFTQTARPNVEAIKGSPFGKELAAGVIDARNTRLETVEETIALVQEIAEVVPPEKITVCPSTSLEYVPRETAFLKLSRCAEIAVRASEVLV
jgi:5-methyltetrahydropteroyltriglutamate--homocysteine methyltransferase